MRPCETCPSELEKKFSGRHVLVLAQRTTILGKSYYARDQKKTSGGLLFIDGRAHSGRYRVHTPQRCRGKVGWRRQYRILATVWYDYNDWPVRETIEYVESGKKEERIRELENDGFFRLWTQTKLIQTKLKLQMWRMVTLSNDGSTGSCIEVLRTSSMKLKYSKSATAHNLIPLTM